MSDTRAMMNTSARLTDTAILLRQDLERIPTSLAIKPYEIANANESIISDRFGYLTIIEGPDACQSNTEREPRYVNLNEDGHPIDRTVGDVDDIIAFTAIARPDLPFRGVIGGGIGERNAAEIIWFVRGNTLYRRMRLIDDETARKNFNNVGDFERKADLLAVTPQKGDYATVLQDESIDGGEQRYDAVQGEWRDLLTLENLARRARRFGNDGLRFSETDPNANRYPFPLYAGLNAGWYYLRMPTFEETDYWSANNIRYWKTETRGLLTEPLEQADMWNQPQFFPDLLAPKSCSLRETAESRNARAGEDVVLTNVLSFDVKVWCSKLGLFVDLGTSGSSWAAVNGLATDLHGQGGYVWDSWTQAYGEPAPYYVEPLEAVQIIIRCFDPGSRIIRQVTVVHRF